MEEEELPLFAAIAGSSNPVSEPTVEQPDVLSVSELNSLARDVLAERFARVWVAGEVADLSRPASGHLYFSLKDDQATIRAVIWRNTAQRLPFDLADGQQILCCGKIDLYVVRGSYQLVVNRVESQGQGTLQQAFEQLRRDLESEGLFAAEHKKPIPWLPQRIVFVTSPTGAAIRYFLEVVRRRWSSVNVVIVPVRVQGTTAASEIANGIHLANQMQPPPDLIVTGRGGGSMEDLWCFNDEQVVRAIFNCSIPVISAVGHEIDVTLADLVADRRALTPSEAGEIAVPQESEVRSNLMVLRQRLVTLLQARLDAARQRLKLLCSRPVLTNPHEGLHLRARAVDDLEKELARGIELALQQGREQMSVMAARLSALSPLEVLQRGYSVTQSSEATVVRSIADIQIGQELHTQLANGKFTSIVESLESDLN
ncbi:MAG: exodeoxyribonuclease VII large subunit [Planctomycetaceae bacterium]|nr:exodeoxyribonuclease VII large subunit [Planctomycetaceae bacterium]